MRILLLTPELLSMGGIQHQNRLLIAGLDEILAEMQGFLNVLVLNDKVRSQPAPGLEDLCVTTIDYFGGSRAAFLHHFLGVARRAGLTIYGHLGFSLMSFLQSGILSRSRRLLMLHGIEAWERRSLWHALAVRSMHGYLSVSRYTLKRFNQAYSIPPSKYTFILPNIVSSLFLSSEPKFATGLDKAPILLSVSRLATHDRPKGIDFVLQSLPLVIKRFPNLRYIIVGDGVDRIRLEALAHDLKLSENVEFCGSVPDKTLYDTYHSCSIFVLPSVKEGFGIVYLEAMACGKPVVAANATAVPEVVIDRETGMLVEYGNVKELANTLITLLENPLLRKRMGKAGRKRVEQLFTFNAMKKRLYSVLHER